MNRSRPDLNLLVIFDAVLRSGSVTGASRDLALSQPAVSHALNRLRDVFKDPLFLRSKQGLVPTARAQQLVVPVQRILSDANLVFAASDFVAETSTRVYNVAASDYSALTFIPNLVRHLRHAAPGVILNVVAFAESSLRDFDIRRRRHLVLGHSGAAQSMAMGEVVCRTLRWRDCQIPCSRGKSGMFGFEPRRLSRPSTCGGLLARSRCKPDRRNTGWSQSQPENCSAHQRICDKSRVLAKQRPHRIRAPALV